MAKKDQVKNDNRLKGKKKKIAVGWCMMVKGEKWREVEMIKGR